ncbi:Hypp4309 [Branchiostoma lanceolatum]|uniref:Hypp4309 protein n=1 Tax=Branchiostoma lanceolatum TaxID=7740 RepID=A0A8K0A9H7_BRALA|nr:Hypp4309 [Branchiostoma lanceolatum]
MLQKAREDQVMNTDHFMADEFPVQAQQERLEFERVLRAEQEHLVEKETEDEIRKNQMRLNHADALDD